MLEVAGVAVQYITSSSHGWGPVHCSYRTIVAAAGLHLPPVQLGCSQMGQDAIGYNSDYTECVVNPEFSTSEPNCLVIKGTTEYDINARYKAIPDLFRA